MEKMLYILFTISIIGGWVVYTLNNVNSEGVNVFFARKAWERTKGGDKPMMNWPKIVLNSFLAFISGVLIICIAPEIAKNIIEKSRQPVAVFESFDFRILLLTVFVNADNLVRIGAGGFDW